MKLKFFSDPHLGLNRFANTTATSRVKLRQEIYHRLCGLLTEDTVNICLGDLFDTYSNDETDLVDGFRVFDNISWCLAGNHDLVNDRTKRGSLDVLHEAFPGRVSRVEVGEAGFHVKPYDGATLFSVPHHAGQDAFENGLQKALDQATEMADPSETAWADPGVTFLLLHCNYDAPEITKADTSLNLSREDAEVLLEAFDYVLIGHEHVPKSDFEGRLQVVGNILPTGFGDISDKRVLLFDTETDELSSETVWDEDPGLAEIPVEWLLEQGDLHLSEQVRFVDVSGVMGSEQAWEVSRAITDRLWIPHQDRLLGVRNNTRVRREQKEVVEDYGEAREPLPERLDKALQGTDMYPLWVELYDQLKQTRTGE